ncbi:MAG: leucine-rich repeat protein [Lachnospiraceae bacterium]|jgi:hypothetical protein
MVDREIRIAEPYRRIGSGAMKNNIKMKRLQIGNSVKEIGEEAFQGCSNLRFLTLDGVRTVQRSAFQGCTSLKTLDIPKSLRYIEKNAFMENKAVREIRYETENLSTVISPEVFRECNRLQLIVLPEKLEKVGPRAFYKCKELDGIQFPATLKEIEEEAFYQNGLTELHLPNGLVKISDSAFFKCTQLEYVRIPESVKIIGKWVFHGCNRLKVLEIPGDPEVVGDWIVNRSCTIRCRKGSKIDKYCQENDFLCEYL